MNGFETPPFINATDSTYVPVFGDETRDLRKVDIEASIWRAKDMRAAHLRSFGRRLAQTLASLWRRPGSIIPKTLRADDGFNDQAVGPA